ncbi:multi-copper oxidase [Penicillium atrosanguineum]|uniref:Multi-copper oxidase n=1 Tax=Penicillium atrosanguineum TaxID=1132637 RepID=A0A9W9UC11_9EURO|nr:multi-copper oxidase [Penicillium atrosanguineum]
MQVLFVTLLLLLRASIAVSGFQQVRHDSGFVPSHVLRVTQESIPVACTSRLSAVVNGSTPGPTIYLKEGQTSWVRVYNDMKLDNLTIANQSPPFPMVLQWHHNGLSKPIIISIMSCTRELEKQGHTSIILMLGALIVEKAEGKSPYADAYDDEKILLFSELFNQTDDAIEEGLTSTDFVWTGEAGAVLLNGKGYRALDGFQAGTDKPYGKSDSSVGTTCGPEVISVKPGKTYRLRVIGGVALSPLVVAFEDHENLTVIAADSRYTQPASTDLIEIGSGQRYDVLLQTMSEEELKASGKSQFWIQMETRYRRQNNTFYALLSYNSDSSVPDSPPTKKPISIPWSQQGWLEQTMEPLEPNDFPSSSEVTRQVVIRSVQLITDHENWTVNNKTWTEDNQHRGDEPFNETEAVAGSPYLVNIYKNRQKAMPNYETALANGGRDPDFNVYPAKVGEVIDIILINEPNGIAGGLDTHPWHIHGGHVWDLGSGTGDYNATANEERLDGYSPILRDTSFLYKYTTGDDTGDGLEYTPQGWRAWRLRVEDAGVWMLHCHILQHMIMGMQVVWVMGNVSEVTRGVRPDLVSGYLSYGGDAYGNSSYDPLVSHYYD